MAEPASHDSQTNMQTRVKRIGLAAIILSMGIFCSRILGYVREAVIAAQAGAGAATDAYNAAFTLPDMMNHFLAGGTFSITFIPLFASYIAKDQPEKAQRLFSLIATTMGIIFTSIVIACEIFAVPLTQLMFPKFTDAQIIDTVRMTRIILPGQIFHYLGGLMMATLMARGHFTPSALAPLIYNLLIILCGVILGPSLGMTGFAIGALIGAFLGPFLLPAVFLRKKVHYSPVVDFKDPDFKKYILLTLPLILGASLTTVDDWLGKFIGGTMAEGSISWINYARKLVLVPIAIVGQAAGQAALPYLSQLSAKGEFDKAADTLHNTLKNVIILSIILIAFFVILAQPMTAIVYERGAFTADDTLKVANILRILAVSIVFWTIYTVSVRAFYATQNTLTPLIISTIVTLTSIPIYIALSYYLDLQGFATASCIGMFLQATCVVLFYHRKNHFFKPAKLLKFMGIGLLLGLCTAAGSYGGLMLANHIHLSSNFLTLIIQLAIEGTCGLIAVIIPARFIIPNEFNAFFGKIKRKVFRKKAA